MRDKPYATAREFRLSANAHMRRIAAELGRPPQEINREFVLQRFLARVFTAPDPTWVLKGGTGLLVRLPHARYSDDVDLLYPTESVELRKPLAELHTAMTQPCGDDFFRFEFGRVDERAAVDGEKAIATVRVAASLGATPYQRFSIDLSVKKRRLTRVDRYQPEPVIEMPGIPALPPFSLYSLADQIADKVCAMYEVHRNGVASTRYHDLVDLELIVSSGTGIDAADTAAALHAEARHRDLSLPVSLCSPGNQWPGGYRKEAAKTSLPKQLHDLEPALNAVNACLGPLLTGTITRGRWDLAGQLWLE